MKKEPLRIVAMLLLAVALLSLSGLSYAASSLLQPECHSSCCEGAADQNGDGPCSGPDCSCFACVTMLPVAPHTLTRSTTCEIPLYLSPLHLHLHEYFPSIDYPPETA